MPIATMCRSIILLASIAFSPRAQAQAALRGDAAACGKRFTPSASLNSTPIVLGATGVRVNVPAGWNVQQATGNNGDTYFQIYAPPAGLGGKALLAASDEPPNRSLNDVAMQASHDMLGAEPARTIALRNFSLQGRCGLQLIVRTQTTEAYFGLIRSGVRVYAVAATYPIASTAAMRGGLDTIVASVVLPAPAATAAMAATAEPSGALDARVVGCWEANPDQHTVRELKLAGDGTYRWTYATVGMPMAVEPNVEYGRYQIRGSSLVTSPQQGEPSTYDATLTGERLVIGSTKYFRCQ